VILVDTSVWIDHLRTGDGILSSLLFESQVVAHPFVIGEIALGYLRKPEETLRLLQNLPRAQVASDEEVLLAIETLSLAGEGIGYVDAHLLASVKLTGTSLWTRDKRLLSFAKRLGVTARL